MVEDIKDSFMGEMAVWEKPLRLRSEESVRKRQREESLGHI